MGTVRPKTPRATFHLPPTQYFKKVSNCNNCGAPLKINGCIYCGTGLRKIRSGGSWSGPK